MMPQSDMGHLSPRGSVQQTQPSELVVGYGEGSRAAGIALDGASAVETRCICSEVPLRKKESYFSLHSTAKHITQGKKNAVLRKDDNFWMVRKSLPGQN